MDIYSIHTFVQTLYLVETVKELSIVVTITANLSSDILKYLISFLVNTFWYINSEKLISLFCLSQLVLPRFKPALHQNRSSRSFWPNYRCLLGQLVWKSYFVRKEEVRKEEVRVVKTWVDNSALQVKFGLESFCHTHNFFYKYFLKLFKIWRKITLSQVIKTLSVVCEI